MPDEVFERLRKRARKAGLPGIASLFLALANESNEDSDVVHVLNLAVKMAQRRTPGEKFRIKDLFGKKKWEDFEKGIRIRAGREFFLKVCAETLGIEPLKKAASGHQWYMRAAE